MWLSIMNNQPLQCYSQPLGNYPPVSGIQAAIHGAYTGITEDKLKSSIYYATLLITAPVYNRQLDITCLTSIGNELAVIMFTSITLRC